MFLSDSFPISLTTMLFHSFTVLFILMMSTPSSAIFAVFQLPSVNKFWFSSPEQLSFLSALFSFDFVSSSPFFLLCDECPVQFLLSAEPCPMQLSINSVSAFSLGVPLLKHAWTPFLVKFRNPLFLPSSILFPPVRERKIMSIYNSDH